MTTPAPLRREWNEVEENSLSGLEALSLELTDRCNLNCIHCYADSSPHVPLYDGMRLADWKIVLRESSELGCRVVQFIGGEPTLHPDLPELIGYSRSLGYQVVEVFSNGTNFSDRLKCEFMTHRVSLAFSVYGSTAKMHERITLGNGSFAKTVENIKWAIVNSLDLRVSVVEMEANCGSADDTSNFLRQIGVKSVRVDHIRGIGRGSARGDRGIDSIKELCGNCWKGKLCIMPNGNAVPCVMSRSWPIGHVSEGIANIIGGRKLYQFRSSIRARGQGLCSPDQCGPDCSPATCGPQKDISQIEHSSPV